jgi:hypothetical protein
VNTEREERGQARLRVAMPNSAPERDAANSAAPLSLIRSGAPFNGARDCSFREPYVDNGMRTMQRASMGGTQRGLKPAKQRAAVAQPRAADGSSPATDADARNLRWKRREKRGVQGGCDTPEPTWEGGGPVKSARWPAVSPKPPGVEEAATGCSGLVCWNWGTPMPLDRPWEDPTRPGCGREGGGGVVANRLVVRTGTG